MEKIILKDYLDNPIHVYIYPPNKGEIKAVVQIVHGIASHMARYGVFAEFLNKQGYLVIGSDMYAHGLSAKTFDHIFFAKSDGDILVYESVLLVKEYIEANYKGKDVFLLGHSFGSTVARKLMLDFPDFYKKAVFSAAYMKPTLLKFFAGILMKLIILIKGPKHISGLVNKLTIDGAVNKLRKHGLIGDADEAWLTRDEEIQQYYHNSNMCGQPLTINANYVMYRFSMDVDSKRNINQGNKETPILFISGENDPVSDYCKDLKRLFAMMEKLDYENLHLKIYPGCFHEILNELNKEEVYQDVLAFLEE